MQRSSRRPGSARTGVPTVIVLLGLGLWLLIPSLAQAQRAAGAFQIGPQVGQPGGLTGKLYRSPQTAYDGLFTTDGDEFVRIYLHRLHERPMPDSLMHLFFGPGLLLGGETLDTTPAAELALSAEIGLNFYAKRFEVFLQATPTLHVLPTVTPRLGGSVGLRYVLRRP